MGVYAGLADRPLRVCASFLAREENQPVETRGSEGEPMNRAVVPAVFIAALCAGESAAQVLTKLRGPFGASHLADVDGVLYMRGTDGYDSELWKSDGTPTGTVLVKDIVLGDDSLPEDITAWNGIAYFSATTASGKDIWRSDGTAAGTYMLKDTLYDAVGYAVHGSSLYFTAGGPMYGIELWKTDGTSSGTALAVDLYAGGDGIQGSSARPERISS